jgi:hypothetical protein
VDAREPDFYSLNTPDVDPEEWPPPLFEVLISEEAA